MVDLANMESVEKECGALGGLFQAIVNDMKCSYPVWEDFSAKATKLHSQLRTTVLAAVAFLDAFQKVADMATNTRGATRDIGSALTRMCMRHRSIEAKLRQFTNALMESLITPLQDKIEDWKKTANQLDKDHAKEYKRSRHEIKKKSSDTMKLQKKARKEIQGRGDLQPQVDSAMQDVTDLCLLMEETEKQAVRRALVEERGRFCTFIGFLQPVVNGEIAMLGEITHLQAIIDDLTVLTTDPHKLPPASEQVIKDLKGSDYSWSYQTPPSSPSSSGSRKSSMCSSLPHQPLPPGGIAAHRLSSVSSHDSGFVSQDANIYSKPPSPMPSDITSQKSSSSASSEASETCQSVSECSSPTTDWSKAGQYEQPVAAAAVQRRKEPLDRLRESEASPGSQGYAGTSHPDDGQRARMTPATIAAKHGEEVSPAASDLAMVLTRGLSMEQQKNSRDSLQYSSGYSTETTTPSCSEDTIPSQGSDYDCYSVNGDAEGPDGQTEFDKSSTIPRHSNIAQNYRRMIQTKRPASTAGLPSGVLGHGISGQSGGAVGGGAGTPGTATIRRTPSTKPGVRRTLSSAGPIPIRPPIVPVKTPTVPRDSHSPGAGGGAYAAGGHSGGVPVRVGSEECVFYAGVEDAQGALDYVKASPKRLSLPNTAWGSGAALEVYAQQHGGLVMGTGSGAGSEEDQMIAANRHSLVEKIGELVASAHALGEGQFPFPTLPDDPGLPPTGSTDAQTGTEEAEGSGDMLTTIRRGVRLRKTVSNDRSAPRIL
ncbi:protein MTSS 2 isoform X3 [Hippoglossus hippoglossus]|uniref:protein MTSS 2 isoform X3 n=1 Tax=Hippoglossus hippoglossus TaxID=8267 RepID=UPI00148D6910|nr:protein MTSS 2 isoform X3 [Hippoglossus hippoglossus]